MARRRQEKKESDLGFDVPPFDEDEFVRKEWISFRSLLVILGYALVVAVVTYLAWSYAFRFTASPFWASLGLAGIFGYGLKWILPRTKVDIAHYGRKEWFGTGATYAFSWLAFFVFILNPPLQDATGPQIIANVVPAVQEPGGAVVLILNVTDNKDVDVGSLFFNLTGPKPFSQSLQDLGGGVWKWTHEFEPGEEGTYSWSVRVEDRDGNEERRNGTFTVATDALRVTPKGGVRSAADRIVVELSPGLAFVQPNPSDPGLQTLRDRNAVWSVYFTREGSSEPHYLKWDKEDKVWYTTPRLDGWTAGNNTLRFHAATHGTYLLDAGEGILSDSEDHTFVVEDDGAIGGEVVKPPRQLPRVVLQTPLGLGTGLAAVLAAFAGRRWLGKDS